MNLLTEEHSQLVQLAALKYDFNQILYPKTSCLGILEYQTSRSKQSTQTDFELKKAQKLAPDNFHIFPCVVLEEGKEMMQISRLRICSFSINIQNIGPLETVSQNHAKRQNFLKSRLFCLNRGGFFCWNIIILIDRQMKNNSKTRKNSRISTKRRSDLIFLVLEKGYTIIKAANKLKLKASTAQQILQRYKESGSFFEKKMNKTQEPESHKKKSQEKACTQQKSIQSTQKSQSEVQNEVAQEDQAIGQENNAFQGFIDYYQQIFANQLFLYYYIPYM